MGIIDEMTAKYLDPEAQPGAARNRELNQAVYRHLGIGAPKAPRKPVEPQGQPLPDALAKSFSELENSVKRLTAPQATPKATSKPAAKATPKPAAKATPKATPTIKHIITRNPKAACHRPQNTAVELDKLVVETPAQAARNDQIQKRLGPVPTQAGKPRSQYAARLLKSGIPTAKVLEIMGLR